MSITITNPTTLMEILSQNSSMPWCLLASITHSTKPNSPINVCSNILPRVSKALDGTNYVYYFGWKFDIQFMSDNYNEAPQATAIIDNTDPSGMIGATILSIASPGSGSIALDPFDVTIGLISLDDQDTLIASMTGLKARAIRGTDTDITARLLLEDILHLPIAVRMSPSRTPGVFGGPQGSN